MADSWEEEDEKTPRAEASPPPFSPVPAAQASVADSWEDSDQEQPEPEQPRQPEPELLPAAAQQSVVCPFIECLVRCCWTCQSLNVLEETFEWCFEVFVSERERILECF